MIDLGVINLPHVPRAAHAQSCREISFFQRAELGLENKFALPPSLASASVASFVFGRPSPNWKRKKVLPFLIHTRANVTAMIFVLH